MKLTINIKIKGYEAAYAGRAIDKPLPADFQNHDEYLIGIIQFDPDEGMYVLEHYETRDFTDGKHYIAASTNKNSVMSDMMIRVYDSSGNLIDGIYAMGMEEDKQFVLCFELSDVEYKKLYDYNGWYNYGEEPFTPSGGEQPSPNIGDLIEQFWPMMQDMMSMMMQMMMMMAMMQAMMSMLTSIRF